MNVKNRFPMQFAAAALSACACAGELPDAGGAHEYARLDWNLIERDIGGWQNLPPLTASQSVDAAACILPDDKDPLDVLIRRTRALIADLSTAGVDLSKEAAELDGIAARSIASQRTWRETRFPAFSAVHALNRRISLKNPLLKKIERLLFVGHEALPLNEYKAGWHMCDQYFGFHATMHGATIGDGLYVLDHPFSDHPVARDLLDGRIVEDGDWKGQTLGPGGYLSPDVSWDGKEIAFAYTRGKGEIRKWNDNTVYHIFVCAADGSRLRQITTGCVNDFDPCWLPNGRIAFISERRGGYGRCHGRPVPTFTLHSMFPDGSDIVRLSPHETNEWHPSVDNDGMILYTRWDYVDRGFSQAHHLWRTTPDGRDPREVNGNTREKHSGSSPLMEMNGRSIPGSRLYAAVATPHHGCAYGSIILVDPAKPDDNRMSQVRRVTPEQPLPESETRGGGQTSGAYATPWPLSEKYFICVYDGNANGKYEVQTIRRYAITLVDVFGNKTRLYTHPTISCLDPMPLQARPRPPVLAHGTLVGVPKGLNEHEDKTSSRSEVRNIIPNTPTITSVELPKTAQIGLVNVYNSRIPFPKDTKVTALRVWQVLPKFSPLTSRPRLGAETQQVARQCLGTVPVEADGSAFFDAPVDVPLYFQALDAEGCTVQNMRSDTYVHPGERLVCNGCHEERTAVARKPGAELPIAMRRKPSKLRPAPDGAKPYSFARLVQPVLDAKCVACHGEKRAPKAPDLRPGDWRKNKNGFTTSYESLLPHVHFFAYDYVITRKRKGYYQAFFEPAYTAPRTTGAYASPLYGMLKRGHHGVELSPEEWERLLVFMGSNAQYVGHDHDVEAQRDGKAVTPPFE